jgi:hypothetical protein
MDMSTEPLIRALDAIISQGSFTHVTPSGPFLTLLSDLAEEGDLIGFSSAFTLFRVEKPQNAEFVRAAVPAKILNGYLLGHLGLSGAVFLRWEKSNRTWAEDIIRSLANAQLFEQTIRNIADGIRSTQDA